MKRRLFPFGWLLTIWMLLATTGLAKAHTVDTVVGAIPGSGGPGGLGGASYSIPITVPEGLGGLKPGIGVVYNSQGGNGLLGWCWDLQGISMVSRAGTTVYHDGRMSGVDFVDDRFALDGQRLVCIKRVYGADGRPHALGSARMYGSPPDQRISYTGFDKLSSIAQDDLTLSYWYGHEHQRIRMVETDGNDTLVRKEYVGACEFVREGTSERTLTYLSGPLGVFAVVDRGALPLDNGVYYVHPDHLGSWTTVTNRTGVVVQDVFFDPWGTPYQSGVTGWVPAQALRYDRGFTGHEHLTDFGLINMNGRVYDPVTSTFLSVDNYVQDPSSTQNFNRYAYCMNNPLKYTDPDGEWAHLLIGALIGGVVNLATNWRNCDGVWQYIAAFGAGAANGALSAALPGWDSLIGGAISGATNNIISQTGKNFSSKGSFDSSSFWTSVASGGFLGGFAGGALSKGSDINMALKAGLNGAITGAAIGGVSGIANGIVESRANNVDFWTGKTSQSNPSSLTTQSATNTKANQMEAQSPVQKGKAGVEKASLELEAEGYSSLSRNHGRG